ncbi:hypothetical protein RHMOL_Rhmol03G0089000 [Rhododendron molle]|uniref:Uncharacterized protein n=1 Tax=Rhododendron molle TaxID=49168 RepID=A0ACC0PDM4_RHOML|nr:hypothetical protein RHMOL_Rhmol03G0089000 [Rhododendron molle]
MDDMMINQTPQPAKVTLVDENRIPAETVSQEFDLPGAESDLPQPSTPTMAFPSFEFRHDQPSHLEQPPLAYPQLEKPLMRSALSKRHFSPSTGKTPRGEKEAVGELLMILVDCMQELNTRSRETLLRKFFSEIERDERLEKFIVERLSQSKVKAISDLCEQLPPSVREKISCSEGETSDSIEEEDPEASAPNDGDQIPSSDAHAGFSGSFDTYYETSGTSERSIIETVEDLSQELERFKVKTLELGGIGQEAQEEGKK